MKAYLNGNFLNLTQARIQTLEREASQAPGLFETARSLRGNIVCLNEHLLRLKKSCRILKIRLGFRTAELEEILRKVTVSNRGDDLILRLTVWRQGRGRQVLVRARAYKPYSRKKYEDGFKLWVSPKLQDEKSLFARVKSTNRLFYETALQGAKKRGFDEALILNKRGQICECSRSNIFWVKNGEIWTPSVSCGCLPGVTRRAIMELAGELKLKVHAGGFKLRDLQGCDEVFLTNSLMGIMPVNKCGIITKLLLKIYACLLK
ncbi:MAG: aminotransferase class IV [Candidatus Omnitrophota bacterium]|nr:aminotransferase class IV [Candidatus Omnitrophota bacterium]